MPLKEFVGGPGGDEMFNNKSVLMLKLGEAETRSGLTIMDLRRMQNRSEDLMPWPLLFLATKDMILFFREGEMESVITALKKKDINNIPAVGLVDFGLSKDSFELKPLSVPFPVNGSYVEPQATISYLEENADKIKHALSLSSF